MHKVEFDEHKEIYAELKNQFMDFNNSYDPEKTPYPKKGEELQEYDDEAKKIWIKDYKKLIGKKAKKNIYKNHQIKKGDLSWKEKFL